MKWLYKMLADLPNLIPLSSKLLTKHENLLKNIFEFYKLNLKQGYQREAKCHLAMGEIGTALHLYNKVLEMEPNNMTAKKEVLFLLLFIYIR